MAGKELHQTSGLRAVWVILARANLKISRGLAYNPVYV